MNLAIKTQPAQTSPTKPSCRSLTNSASNHIQAACRITDVDDLRYFTMRDLQAVRINLHLALELSEVIKQGEQ